MATAPPAAPDRLADPHRPWLRAVPWIYYGGLGLVIVLILAYWMSKIIPNTVGSHIGWDNEGYLLAFVLPLWIEFVRPRIAGRRSEWWITGGVALALFVVSIVLYRSDSITGTVKTLNETTFAMALIIPYIQSARRPSRITAILVAVGAFAVMVALDHSPLVWVPTNLAEGFVMLVLAPLAFDAFDTGILTPDRPSALRTRIAWCIALIVVPLVFIGLRRLGFDGTLGAALRFAARPQEAFVGFFLISGYFFFRRWPMVGSKPANERVTAGA